MIFKQCVGGVYECIFRFSQSYPITLWQSAFKVRFFYVSIFEKLFALGNMVYPDVL